MCLKPLLYLPPPPPPPPPGVLSLQVQAGAGGKKLKVARVTVVRQAALLDGLPPGSERRGLR